STLNFEFYHKNYGNANYLPGRTPCDRLIAFDLSSSGTGVNLHLLEWLTSANATNANDCFAAHSLPCWGNRVDLTGASEGSMNHEVFTDPISGDVMDFQAKPSGDQSTFGEAGVDLTAP